MSDRYDDENCADCEGSGIMHQTEKYCTCDAGLYLSKGNAVIENLYDQSYLDATVDTLNLQIKELEKACAEWAEVSQGNYQRAKTADARIASLEAQLAAAQESAARWQEESMTQSGKITRK